MTAPATHTDRKLHERALVHERCVIDGDEVLGRCAPDATCKRCGERLDVGVVVQR